MKVGVRCFYVVGRPPVNFPRIRSSFDAPTDNYSGNIAGLTSDVFGLRKQLPGLPLFSSLTSRPSTQPTTYRQVQPNLSRQPAALLACASENCPGPDPSSRHRCVRIIPKHLQNVSVLLIGLPNIFFLSTARFYWRNGLAPKLSLFPYIYILSSLNLEQTLETRDLSHPFRIHLTNFPRSAATPT